ncbi:hypothetical protein ACFIOY_02395 [Bradyrhizobium sp. TZ2]
MTKWYFVWVEGLRGPAPQKWSSDGLWGQVSRQDVIVRFALTDEEARLSLDELARLHPIRMENSPSPLPLDGKPSRRKAGREHFREVPLRAGRHKISKLTSFGTLRT